MKKKIEIKTYNMGESLLAGIIFLIFGIFLMTNPGDIITVAIVITGIFVALLGVFKLLIYYKTQDGNKKEIISGGVFIILGMALILWALISPNTVKMALSVLIAIYLFYVGINRIIYAFKVKGNKKPYFVNALIIIAVAIALAVVPFVIAELPLILLGILIALYGVAEIVGFIFGRKNMNEFGVAEAVIVKEQISTKDEDVKLLK